MKHSQKYWEVQMLIPLPWKVRLAHFLRLSLFSHLSHSLYLIQATSISFSISILALLCYQNLYCHIIALKHISRTNSRRTEIWRHFREMAINTLMDSRLWQNLLGVTTKTTHGHNLNSCPHSTHFWQLLQRNGKISSNFSV